MVNQSSKLSLTRPMHLIQQLKLWKALDFSGSPFLLLQTSYAFLKPGLGISCKNGKHMFEDTFLLSFCVCLGLHIVVMIAGIHNLQEIFAIDMLTVLKPFLEHDRKHVLRLSRLF